MQNRYLNLASLNCSCPGACGSALKTWALGMNRVWAKPGKSVKNPQRRSDADFTTDSQGQIYTQGPLRHPQSQIQSP